MQQIRITRTSELDNVLSFLKRRYPLLSEAEIIKMALSNQYYQETRESPVGRPQQDPSQRFTTTEEWEKGFGLMDKMRANTKKFAPQEVEHAIEQAVKDVRQKTRV
jgi:hypothetical protein